MDECPASAAPSKDIAMELSERDSSPPLTFISGHPPGVQGERRELQDPSLLPFCLQIWNLESLPQEHHHRYSSISDPKSTTKHRPWIWTVASVTSSSHIYRTWTSGKNPWQPPISNHHLKRSKSLQRGAYINRCPTLTGDETSRRRSTAAEVARGRRWRFSNQHWPRTLRSL